MDQQTAARLYEQHKTGIFRFALSILGSEAAAEDVLQETFIRLLLPDRVPYQPGKAQAWLYKVARNLCCDQLRRRKRQSESFSEPSAHDAPQWEFTELISSLSELDRQIVSLKIIGGFTHREIAAIVGLTVPGAKKRYERAIQNLKTELEGCL